MSKYVRVVRGSGIRAAIHGLKMQSRAEMNRHPDVLRYLRDTRRATLLKVQACGTRARVVAHEVKPDLYKVRLYGCKVEPWCSRCCNEAKHRRARDAMARFQKCKPADQDMRLAHVVQTAHFSAESGGWGDYASKDVDSFRRIVARVVQESFGSGYGAYFSYQDFGERAFGKRHPHLDFTVNGWSLAPEGGAVLTRTYDTTHGGYDQWVQRTRQHAAAAFLLHDSYIGTNLKIQRWRTGYAAYYNAMLYQVRELVDVRKMTYDRSRGVVYWSSYRDNTREKMTVNQFEEGLADYQFRLGPWGHYQGRRLHVGMGHLADGRLPKTMKAMGGEEPAHRRNCQCADCQEWSPPLQPDDDGDYAFDPWRDDEPLSSTSPLALAA